MSTTIYGITDKSRPSYVVRDGDRVVRQTVDLVDWKRWEAFITLEILPVGEEERVRVQMTIMLTPRTSARGEVLYAPVPLSLPGARAVIVSR